MEIAYESAAETSDYLYADHLRAVITSETEIGWLFTAFQQYDWYISRPKVKSDIWPFPEPLVHPVTRGILVPGIEYLINKGKVGEPGYIYRELLLSAIDRMRAETAGDSTL